MENDIKSLNLALILIDMNINEWQLYAKTNELLCDFAFNIVNMLVDKKKQIVEKLKKLDILYLNNEYPQIHNDNNNNNN